MGSWLGRFSLVALVVLGLSAPAAASEDVAAIAREAGAELRSVFTRLDRNGDGLLQPREAPAYVREGKPLTYADFLQALDGPPVPAEARRVRNPVLILPGFLMPEWCYETLQKRLERAGHQDVVVFRGWPWVRSIQDYAAEAHREAERLRVRTGAAKVDVVAHSMGGLIARTMIQDLGYEDRVEHLVTFGTPHHGTLIGPLASWYATSAAEMTVGSSFLAALNRQEGRPSAVKYTSIHAQFDEIVYPRESVNLAGARNLQVPMSGHILIIYMPELARTVADALTE